MEDQILFEDFDLFDASQVDAFINKLRDMDGAVKESIDWVRKLAEANKILAEKREEAYSTDAIKKMTDRTVNAYEQLTLAGTSYARVLAVVENALGKARKGLRLETEEIMAAKGSYNELKAQYDRALVSVKAMAAETDKEKTARDAAIKTLQDYKTQLNELERSFGTQPFETGVSKLGGRLANIQKEGEEMARLRMQLSELQKVQKNMAALEVGSPEAVKGAQELADKIQQLNAEYASGAKSIEQYSAVLHQLLADSQALVQAEKQRTKEETLLAQAGSQVTIDTEGRVQVANLEKMTYNELQATYKLLIEVMKNYTHEQMESEAAAKDNVATQARVTDMLAKMDQNVGKTARRWDGLRMQVTQLVREMPSAAISMNTFFLAISNNLPYFIDELTAARKEAEELKKAGKDYVPVGKQVARAFLSWNAILAVAMTALSIYGADLVKFVGRLLSVGDAADTTGRALGNLTEEIEKSNANYGQSLATLEKLSILWRNLSSLQERTKFLKMYSSEINSLGLGIKSVDDAEIAFNKQTETIKKAYAERARAAAAMKLAQEEYEKALKETIEREKVRTRTAEMQQSIQSRRTRFGRELASGWYGLTHIRYFSGGREESSRREEQKALKNARTYLDLMNKAAAEQDKLLSSTGLSFRGEERGKRQIDLLNRLNSFQLDAMKKFNDMAEATMEDGYDKRIKIINDRYAETRKEIQKQMDAVVTLINKELGAAYGSFAEAPSYMIEWAVQNASSEMERQLLGTLLSYREAIEQSYKAQGQDVRKEQLAEATAVANAARDAVQLRLDAVQKGGQEEYDLRLKLIWKEYNAEIAANNEKEENKRQNSLAIYKKYLKQADDLRREWDIQQLDYQIGNIQYQESALPQGPEQFALQMDRLKLEREKAVKENEGLVGEARKEEADINAYWDRQEQSALIKYYQWRINQRQTLADAELGIAKKNSQQELQLLLEQNSLQGQQAVSAAWEAGMTDEEVEKIKAKYRQLAQFIKGDYAMRVLDDQQALAEAIFNVYEHTEQEITAFSLRAERERWLKQIELAKKGMLNWSNAQIAAAEAAVQGIDRQLSQLEGFGGLVGRIAEHGLLGIFDMTDEQYDAWGNMVDFISDNIDTIIDKYIELAEAAVDAAQEQVDAARTVYEAELEARANGYANNVATAKAELQAEKEKLKEKQKLLDEANRVQQAADLASQASSLITAVAQLYKAYAGIPFGGLVIASAAAAGMLSMFFAARASVKSSLTSSYGEGGYEMLQGGSHASGNDIDLGVRNGKGRRMKAEGGESMAIFSRKAVKRYGDTIPSVVDSFNNGDFGERYAKSFDLPAEVKYVGVQGSVDLSRIETKLDELKAQGAEKISVLPDGTLYVRKGNVTRIIRN